MGRRAVRSKAPRQHTHTCAFCAESVGVTEVGRSSGAGEAAVRRTRVVGAADRPLAAQLSTVPTARRKTATAIAGRAARRARKRHERLPSNSDNNPGNHLLVVSR